MSTLDRINHALAVQDAMPTCDGDWLPGDPLHERPSGSAFGEQTIRPMFEIVDDATRPRCEPCEVSWSGISARCWVCGEERPPQGVRAWFDYIDSMLQAADRSSEAVAQQLEVVLRQLPPTEAPAGVTTADTGRRLHRLLGRRRADRAERLR